MRDVVLEEIKNEFISEKEYQKFKKQINKKSDYFTFSELKKIYKKLT